MICNKTNIHYNINDAVNSKMQGTDIFILSNEKLLKNGRIGRYYEVFSSFKIFLKNRKKYPHCHEILLDHVNNEPDISGRLVFDFDISNEISIPSNFKKQIEKIFFNVIDKYFIEINKEIIEFIWSTSQNPAKFSKHLTVKNMYFEDWIIMSKIFYKFFCEKWDKKYDWISSDKLIDFQIVRKRGSLRMVGSKKINGYRLVFDNKDDTLIDSLIRIYSKQEREHEQLVTMVNFKQNILEKITKPMIESNIINEINIGSIEREYDNTNYDNVVYDRSYQLVNYVNPKIFKMGKISGKIMSLIRIKEYECLLSGRIHENENAYCIINQHDETYSVHFGCNRSCHKQKLRKIGQISINDLTIVEINCPKFDDQCNPIYDPIVYKKTFKLIDKLCPKTFEMGKINAGIFFLNRIKKNKCLLSRKNHNSDNAYCIINKNQNFYSIIFGCYRYYCGSFNVASITTENYIESIHPSFDKNNY